MDRLTHCERIKQPSDLVVALMHLVGIIPGTANAAALELRASLILRLLAVSLVTILVCLLYTSDAADE